MIALAKPRPRITLIQLEDRLDHQQNQAAPNTADLRLTHALLLLTAATCLGTVCWHSPNATEALCVAIGAVMLYLAGKASGMLMDMRQDASVMEPVEPPL